MAADGLKYTCFHTTVLCSPTRAALLTGRNHHSTGNGVITEAATGYEGYTGIIGNNLGTIAQVLRQYGYATAWFGKNHNTPDWETSSVGPFDRWPSGGLEPFEVGRDSITPIDRAYKDRGEFEFTGEIEKVGFELVAP